jgi:hypothetical protein
MHGVDGLLGVWGHALTRGTAPPPPLSPAIPGIPTHVRRHQQVVVPARTGKGTPQSRASSTPSFSTGVGNVGGGHVAAVYVGQPGTSWSVLARAVTSPPPGYGSAMRDYLTLQWATVVRSDYEGFVSAPGADKVSLEDVMWRLWVAVGGCGWLWVAVGGCVVRW